MFGFIPRSSEIYQIRFTEESYAFNCNMSSKPWLVHESADRVLISAFWIVGGREVFGGLVWCGFMGVGGEREDFRARGGNSTYRI